MSHEFLFLKMPTRQLALNQLSTVAAHQEVGSLKILAVERGVDGGVRPEGASSLENYGGSLIQDAGAGTHNPNGSQPPLSGTSGSIGAATRVHVNAIGLSTTSLHSLVQWTARPCGLFSDPGLELCGMP